MTYIKYILDSSKRFRGTNQQPVFNLPNSGINANSCYVNMANIPHSFYNISVAQNNNVINWTDNSSSANVSTIPNGNYTIDTLLTEIGTQMSADTTDGFTYSATKNDTTNKITITHDGGANNFSIEWDTGISTSYNQPSYNLAKILGFTGTEQIEDFFGDNNNINVLSGASSFTGNNVYWLGFPKNLYIKCNIAKKSRQYESSAYTNEPDATGGFVLNSGLNDILLVVPVNTNPGDNIIWRPLSGPELIELDPRSNITQVSFTILDDNYNVVALNGISWIIELVFNI